MTETVRYSLIGKQDLALGTSQFEVTLADGRVVILDELNLVEFPSGLTVGSILFVGTGADGAITEDNANLQWDDTLNVLKVLNIRVLATGTYRQVDGNAQLIHAFGTIV